MEPHIGAKFQEIPALGYGDTQDRTDERTDGTEFQGPIPPSSGDQYDYWVIYHMNHKSSQ